MNQNQNKKEVKNPVSQGKPRIRLPFENNTRGDWAEWVYAHRIGLLVTLVIYLVAAISFLSYRIVLTSPEMGSSTILTELLDPQQIEPEVEPEKKTIEQLQEAEYEKVMNRLSNENAKESTGKQRQSNALSEAERETQRINAMLNQGRQAYESGVREADAIAGAKHRKPTSDSKTGKDSDRQRDRVKGNVVVSYDLPGRTDTYLHIPAYECQSGGRVVVAVTVNRNGRVIAATVEKATSSGDDCILDMAITAAKNSSFNVSSSAPEKQRGTISYIFVAQ